MVFIAQPRLKCKNYNPPPHSGNFVMGKGDNMEDLIVRPRNFGNKAVEFLLFELLAACLTSRFLCDLNCSLIDSYKRMRGMGY